MGFRIFATIFLGLLGTSTAFAAMDDLPGVPVSVTDPVKKQTAPRNISLTPDFKSSSIGESQSLQPGMPLADAQNIAGVSPAAVKNEKIDKSLFKSTKVGLNVIPGENMILPVSVRNPNRLVTPFPKPRVTTASDAEITIDSSIVYATPDDESIITMFITDEEGDQRSAISLTLVPRKIPPREVRLMLSDEKGNTYGPGGSAGALFNNAQATEWEKGNPYTDALRDTMRELALGKAPQGYGLRKYNPGSDPVPECQNAAFSVKAGQVLDGHNIVVVVSLLTNVSDKIAKFKASSCYKRGLLAAAAWPKTVLAPNESVELYTLFKRPDPAEEASVRPSLIGNGGAR